jgi:hypothetical protein
MLAERGIGGTGMAPISAPAPPVGAQPGSAPASGGIGGTGLPSGGAKSGGNTGIVGAITGFASICLNGLEVAYDPDVQTKMDGQSASVNQLRAGQIVAIVAAPDASATDGLRAAQIAVRHEVTGPAGAVAPDRLVIAGQTVARNADTRGIQTIRPGDWVAVSGQRNPAGIIVATRIDPATPGQVMVHGTVAITGGRFMIGGLKLRLPLPNAGLQPGQAVAVSGTLQSGELIITSIQQDLLYSDPQAYFGTGVSQYLLQSYVTAAAGGAYLAGGAAISLTAAAAAQAGPRPVILSLQPVPGGPLRAINQSPAGLAPGAMPTGMPAGMPMGMPMSAPNGPAINRNFAPSASGMRALPGAAMPAMPGPGAVGMHGGPPP